MTKTLQSFLADFQTEMESLRAIVAELREFSSSLKPAAAQLQATVELSSLALDPQKLQMLTTLAELRTAGVIGIPRNWLALSLGFAWPSGKINSNISALCKLNAAFQPSKKLVSISESAAKSVTVSGFSFDRMVRRAYDTMDRQSADILHFLSHAPENVREWTSREELAAGTGQSKTSSSFRERLTELQAHGFVEFNREQGVRLALHWLPDSALRATAAE